MCGRSVFWDTMEFFGLRPGLLSPTAFLDSRILACAPKAFNQVPEIFNRLNSTQRRRPVRDKRRHATHTQTSRLAFICQYARGKLVTVERLAKRMTIEAQLLRESDQHVNLSDVLTSFEEGAKDFVVVILKATLRPRPVRRLMRQPRAGFHWRKPHRHPESLSQRRNGIAPAAP